MVSIRQGILTPQQAAMMLVAFDVLASDKADLERLFSLVDSTFCFSDSGRAAPETPNPRLPPLDSGILGGYIAPDNLTITLSWVTRCLMSALALRHRCQKKVAEDDAFP